MDDQIVVFRFLPLGFGMFFVARDPPVLSPYGRISRDLTLSRSKTQVYRRSPSEVKVSNPAGVMNVYCECCVLSGRGLCVGLISHREESCRLWCVVACDLEISWTRRPWPALGRSATGKTNGALPSPLQREEIRKRPKVTVDCSASTLCCSENQRILLRKTGWRTEN